MDQVMNDTGMVWILSPELFQNGRSLKLLGQTGVTRRGITDSQDRETVKGLHFEVLRIFVAKLPHRRFVGNDAVAGPHWSIAHFGSRSATEVKTRRASS